MTSSIASLGVSLTRSLLLGAALLNLAACGIFSKDEDPYPEMARLGVKLATAINRDCEKNNVDMHIAQLGGMFTPFFCDKEVMSMTDAKCCDTKRHAEFFHAMLKDGVYLPPSQFEVAFISAAHTEDDIDTFIEKALSSL